jgi:hypothetical protein
MIPESIQIPLLIATILALASLLIIPVIAVTDWKDPPSSSIEMSGTPEGASCALPPMLDIEEDAMDSNPVVLPSLGYESNGAARELKKATFALG